MGNVFSSGPGMVAVLPDTGLPLKLVGLEGFGTFDDMRAVITQLGISSQSKAQFLETLRSFVYVYSFGEAMGEMMIGGLAMPGACGQPTGPPGRDPAGPPPDFSSGLERVLKYYGRNRLSTRGNRLKVAIGATLAYDAFLVGMRADIVDPQLGLTQFTLQLRHLQNQ